MSPTARRLIQPWCVRVVALGVLLCGLSCAPGRAPVLSGPLPLPPSAARAVQPTPKPQARELAGLRYRVRLDERLVWFDVEVCFEGPLPAHLVYGARHAARFLREPQYVAPTEQRTKLVVREGLILLPARAADGCVEYGVDVEAALALDALMLAYPGERSLLFASELFLWRPPRRSPELQAQVRFELPEGMHVSTPWQPDTGEHGFRLDERAFAFTGHLVVGHFEAQDIAGLHAVILQGFGAAARDQLTAWLARAARVASLPGGMLPVPGAQVIVVPTSPSPFPIHFGHTGRSGGASIVLFVPTDVAPAQLRQDWIAIHELSHLWHPFIRREDAWLSEGLATYLQEVLRVRAGLEPASMAWQRLYDGASLGRQSTRTLVDETRGMVIGGEHNYQRVYWAGAAIALMIDVQLRKDSAGQHSLDGLLARVHARSELFARGASAAELLTALDSEAGRDTCHPIARRYLDRAGLPALDALYADLGITPDSGEPSADRGAPLAWIRDAIMQPSPAVRLALP